MAAILPEDISVRLLPGSVDMIFSINAHDNPSAQYVQSYLANMFENITASAAALNLSIDTPVLVRGLAMGAAIGAAALGPPMANVAEDVRTNASDYSAPALALDIWDGGMAGTMFGPWSPHSHWHDGRSFVQQHLGLTIALILFFSIPCSICVMCCTCAAD